MGFEVELKAHVQDPEKVKALLPLPVETTEKQDIYWHVPGIDEPSFRTRLEKHGPNESDILFTTKVRHKEHGVESNEEFEYSAPADQWDKVQVFMRKLGYEVFITKHKKGYSSMIPVAGFVPAHAELLEVEPLGWFIEIEFVIDDPHQVDHAKAALFGVLESLGVSQEAIEPLGYSKMLRAARA